MIDFGILKREDEAIFNAMVEELRRQQNNVELIASENFVSPAVMTAAGSHLTNKYAEGYPGRRYYGGCQYVDKVENIAIDRVRELFGGEYINVQPHSGSSANIEVYYSLLKPGDTIMGMNLSHGGHLTHGSPASMSGSYFKVVAYGVDEKTGYIDYKEVERIAKEERPQMIIAGASAYPRKIDFKEFRRIADEVGAILMVDMAHIAGLVAAGLHENPVPYADVVTTTTHKTLRGARGGLIIAKEKYAKALAKGVFPGTQGGPLMHIIAAKAVALKEALSPEFKSYQIAIVENAKALAESLKKRGVKLFSDGTDNHLMLLDLRGTGVSGKTLETRLDEVNITTNKNTIPFDDASPFDPNGLRIGTPAVTTRGMGTKEMDVIGECIADAIFNFDEKRSEIQSRIKKLTEEFPLYKEDFILQ